jgi:predicted nucleic acid-binding protein
VTPVLIDSNVLLDVALEDPNWGAWSVERLAALGDEATLVINPVIYAELTPSYATPEDLDRAWPATHLRREELPYTAAFLAGRMHQQYRMLGGTRDRTLPDFLIGAHAVVRGYRLLTRDARRYRTYFPKLEIITPDGHPR